MGYRHTHIRARAHTHRMTVQYFKADPGGRAVKGVGLRPLACWNCGFESHRGHECLL